jgi:endonuclease-3
MPQKTKAPPPAADPAKAKGGKPSALPAQAKPQKRASGKAAAPLPAAVRRARPAPVVVPTEPKPAPRRRAVANAAAAAHGRTLAAWSEAEIVEAFTRFEAADPEPKGELEHSDPFTLLVAVVLSAQATDAGVNKATRGLFAAAATPAAMAALGEEEIARHIRTLGLFKGKAKNVAELSRLLIARHGGQVPRDREALEALPGVGRKTANVVLNIAFGEPTIAVDTHLFRVANRTGLAPGATPLAVEEGLEARIPDRFKLHAHHWLILHGRYICKARQPECRRCLIADLCRWPEKII